MGCISRLKIASRSGNSSGNSTESFFPKPLDKPSPAAYNDNVVHAGAWCNGNTWVSKTFVEGSNPSAPANRIPSELSGDDLPDLALRSEKEELNCSSFFVFSQALPFGKAKD